jgi:hypothetical protein
MNMLVRIQPPRLRAQVRPARVDPVRVNRGVAKWLGNRIIIDQ